MKEESSLIITVAWGVWEATLTKSRPPQCNRNIMDPLEDITRFSVF